MIWPLLVKSTEPLPVAPITFAVSLGPWMISDASLMTVLLPLVF